MGEKLVVQVYLGKHTEIAKKVLKKSGAIIRDEFTAYGHTGSYYCRDDYLRCELPDGGTAPGNLKKRLKRAEFKRNRRIADFDVLQEHESFETCDRFDPESSRISRTLPDGKRIPRQIEISFKRW